MKKYIFISVLTAIVFLSNCSKDMYQNTANTPVLFAEQLKNSFKQNHSKQLEALTINQSDLIETLTQCDRKLAQKYSLNIIKLANNRNRFIANRDLIFDNFSKIKKQENFDWHTTQLLNASYQTNDNHLEMSGLLIIQDKNKNKDTIYYEAVKLHSKWYLSNLKKNK
jgi:hypothetical protein